VSASERRRAKLNRELREQERLKRAADDADPVSAVLNAYLAAIGWPSTSHKFGTRGPRSDPDGMLTDLRDLHVARLVLSARAAGWGARAITLGVEALRRSGASSPKTVEAILTKRRRFIAPLLTPAEVEEAARRYGVDTTKACKKE
jgi:hypothetical protein